MRIQTSRLVDTLVERFCICCSARGNSEAEARKTGLDLGAGEALVGRRMRKAIGGRSKSEGHVASYDDSARLYQVLQLSLVKLSHVANPQKDPEKI